MRKQKIYMDLEQFSCNTRDVRQEEILLTPNWRKRIGECFKSRLNFGTNHPLISGNIAYIELFQRDSIIVHFTTYVVTFCELIFHEIMKHKL